MRRKRMAGAGQRTMARIVYDVLVPAEQCEEEFKAAVLARFLGTSTNSVQATA